VKRARFALLASSALVSQCATTQSNRREAESPEVQQQLEQIRQTPWQQLADDAERAAQTGDYTRSEQYFVTALARGAPAERVLPRLLRVCTSAHRYRAAIEYSRGYLLERENAWSLRFVVAAIHIGLNEPLTASRHLELVLRHNPQHAEAEFLLGTLYRDDLRDPGKADEHFRRYLELAPDGEHANAARDGLLQRVDEAAARARQAEADGGGAVLVSVNADAAVDASVSGLRETARLADAGSDATRRR
jgi:Tfp pilus assembly protein PilF